MSPKKGLIGLFVLTFFLSTIGLALLVLDDQKDLSSRADLGLISNLQPALPEGNFIENNPVWDGRSQSIPAKITYNPSVWLPPQSDAPLFYHQNQLVTVRVTSESLDSVKLAKVLGPDFTTPKPIPGLMSEVEGWSLKSFSYKFFGAEKIVDLWTNSEGITLLAVMPDLTNRRDVEDLVSQVVSLVDVPEVKGASTPDDSARLAAAVRPSVVMILNNYCAQARLDAAVYPFCLAQSGSGFFVNKDGYIATNGHVVSNLPETALFYGVTTGGLDNLLIDSLQAYFTVLTGAPVDRAVLEAKIKEAHASKETIYQMAALIGDMYKKNFIKLESPINHYYVQLGNTPIQLSKTGVNTGPDIVPATFIAADYADPDPVLGFTTSDVALLKINGTNFPALPLGNIKDVGVGSGVLLVGFPGVAMGSNSLLLDTSANAEPTFTKGVVSAFKQAKGNKKNLIQTDASINHGNSGGPAVSSEGKVVGLATYGLTPEEGGGNYNFLRDIADLKELMVKNNVTEEIGDTYNIWKSGLNNYWLSYFKYANDDFEKVSTVYPEHPTAKQYIGETGSKLGTVEDKTPKLTRTQRKLYINLSGGTMTFSVLMIIVLGISNYIDSKRRRAPVILPPRGPLSSQPIQTF
ncbi:MAG: peptidase S1 and S6, chymotrypsin/Hap [uncultured bacterium]|nr:MAG: peptidase S1 and S6, chymotrypsin/Hap [uncultured bacterium]